jgi:nicotinamidase-related amidase
MTSIEKHLCALLVIDMQEYFRSIVIPILPELTQLIHCCRNANVPVIFTHHAHKNPIEDAGMLAKWWEELIIDGTPQAEILSEIKLLPTEKIIHKNRYSAFFNTDLDRYLQQHYIQQLIIGGVMTNLCCETTARDAFVHDYEVFFLKDGTATSNEDFQQATLLNLSFGFAQIMTCQEICNAINQQEIC